MLDAPDPPFDVVRLARRHYLSPVRMWVIYAPE
jgi:hypothetical protein